MRVVPGLHRVSLGYAGPKLDSVVLHVTRLLPGTSVEMASSICGSYYNIPKAIFYLLKGDYMP